MLLIDIPVGLVAGQVIADAGRDVLRSGNRGASAMVRAIAIIFAFVITTPVIIYFFMGWPAWETNYFWEWVDHIQGTPRLAMSGFLIIAMALIPTLAGFEIGKFLLKKGRDTMLRILYSAVFLLILVIVYISRDMTFNIAATYADYKSGVFRSFWNNPFFIYWLVLTVYFWGALVGCYIFVRRRFRNG